MRWDAIMVLIGVYILINDDKHLFKCLLAFYISLEPIFFSTCKLQPLGVECLFHRGCLRPSKFTSDIYIMIPNSSKIAVMK